MLKIEKLRKKESDLIYLKSLRFNDELEFQSYFQINKDKFNALAKVQKRIRKIEWKSKNQDERRADRVGKINLAKKFNEDCKNFEYENIYVKTLDVLYEEVFKNNNKPRDLIYNLALLLCLFESKPFVRFDFDKHIKKEFDDLLKTHCTGLYQNLKSLDLAKKDKILFFNPPIQP